MNKAVAVIEIGSTGIRLLVAQTDAQGNKMILDKSEQSVSLGRDVFTTGAISRTTLLICLQILSRFKEQLGSYAITSEETIVIATSSLREASNRDPVVDRIKVKTGFNVRVIDGIEENRLMYLAVTECFKPQDAIIMEVSGGSTEIMLTEGGRVAGAHSLRLGTVIIEQQLNPMMNSREDEKRYIDEFIRNTKGTLNYELNLSKVKEFIAVSSEARITAHHIGEKLNDSLWKIKRSTFEAFVFSIQGYTPELLSAKLRIAYADANGFCTALLIYSEFVHLTNAEYIIVPETSIREGLFISKTAAETREIQNEFNEQVTASARNLLRKYRGDEKHAEYVRRVSLEIFDSMSAELGLEEKARLYLEVSAILHDIGMFIRASDHEEHSCYIVLHSDIFGLTRDELRLISIIVRYHRSSIRPREDEQYKALARSERLTILKLSAILRAADALDRGHQQKIKDFTLSFSDDSMTVRAGNTHNIMLEKLALEDKGELFESVFGYKIVLV